ncbi:sulfatase [Botrimarina sp.]|uniref:sulfatase family protein n=1 Tax=Botrimarina sp. TaxID=2795802 RepID=UPI0032EFC9AF
MPYRLDIAQRSVALPLVLALWVIAGAATAGDRPNVLLILADDLGLQLSCYGDKHIETPNVDAIAASGARFEVCYTAQASCSPSRASIYTGLFPHTHGHIGLAKPHNPPLAKKFQGHTLPHLMRAAGYRTAVIGKLHVNPKSAFRFDLQLNAELGPNNGREVRAMAAASRDFVRGGDGEPFCLVVSYVDPHHPFSPQLDGLPEDPMPVGAVPPWPFQRVDGEALTREATNYYNCVRRLDAGVGMLMKELESSGHADDTLVIFVSDHGPPFVRAKTTCYEAGLRVPLLVRWPGVAKPGHVSGAFTSTVDILPTILDATGLDTPAHVQGRSLRSVAAGDDTSWRTSLAGEYHQHVGKPFFPRRAIRDSRYKVIHNLLAGELTIDPGVDGDTAYQIAQSDRYQETDGQRAMARQADPPEWELYDLRDDPWEFQNLARDPQHRETLRRMQGLILDWRVETDDPFLDATELEAKHREVNL